MSKLVQQLTESNALANYVQKVLEAFAKNTYGTYKLAKAGGGIHAVFWTVVAEDDNAQIAVHVTASENITDPEAEDTNYNDSVVALKVACTDLDTDRDDSKVVYVPNMGVANLAFNVSVDAGALASVMSVYFNKIYNFAKAYKGDWLNHFDELQLK